MQHLFSAVTRDWGQLYDSHHVVAAVLMLMGLLGLLAASLENERGVVKIGMPI